MKIGAFLFLSLPFSERVGERDVFTDNFILLAPSPTLTLPLKEGGNIIE